MTNSKIVTMARYIARKRIIEELRSNGVKLQSIEPADILKATNMLLEVNGAELVEEAKARLT